MPSSALQHMVALPTTRRAWQKAAGQSPQRALLIRAGAGRRREYDAGSQTARALARLLRREPQLWDVALQATSSTTAIGGACSPTTICCRWPAIRWRNRYPSRVPRRACARGELRVGSDEDEKLVRVADVVAERLEALDGATETDEDAERHRIGGLEDLVATLTKDLKESERRLRAAMREAQQVKDRW